MGDDDLLLDNQDLADIFGTGEEEEVKDEDLGKTLEDLFFSGDDEDAAGGSSTAAVAEPPAKKRAPEPAAEEEPEPVEPERQAGLTEEEWRASPEYQNFKKQVIARHLRRKAEEDARRRREEEAKKEAEQSAHTAEEEKQFRQAKEEEAKRKQELVEKYKAAKAATIAQRAEAMVSEAVPSSPEQQAMDQEKESKFRARLADMKNKMASQGGFRLGVSKVTAEVRPGGGIMLDLQRCLTLAFMFEETRRALLKHLSLAIPKKAAQTMMMKTQMKVSKARAAVFGRADVDRKGQYRPDGTLDEDRLARNFYAMPEAERAVTALKGLHDLLELRFIAIEVGVGMRGKSAIISKTLTDIENIFFDKRLPGDLVKWYMSEVIPSTTLQDGDEEQY